MLVEIVRTGDPKSDVVGNCAHALASITHYNPGARMQCIALNVFPLAVQILYSKPPPKNASPTKPEVEPYDGNPETKPSTTEAAALSVADQDAVRRNVNASSKIVWCGYGVARRAILGTDDGDEAEAPLTLDKSSLGLDDHVNAAYRNALSLEQPAPPKDDKGHSPFNRWASTVYSVCDLLINLLEYTEYGVPAAFEAGLLPAIVPLIGDSHRDQALLAQTILKHMYKYDSNAVVTALWSNPRAMVGLLHYAKDDPESESMAHDVLRRVFYVDHHPMREHHPMSTYRCDLTMICPETLARCMPDLLGISANETNKSIRDLRYTRGRFCFMVKQAKRLQHLSTCKTEYFRLKSADAVKFKQTLISIASTLRVWIEHMSILVENIFSSQHVYVPNPPGFEIDTRTKILKKAVTAILANKFDDPAIAKYCLNVDGVVQQALRWATWKRDTSGNMEFGF